MVSNVYLSFWESGWCSVDPCLQLTSYRFSAALARPSSASSYHSKTFSLTTQHGDLSPINELILVNTNSILCSTVAHSKLRNVLLAPLLRSSFKRQVLQVWTALVTNLHWGVNFFFLMAFFPQKKFREVREWRMWKGKGRMKEAKEGKRRHKHHRNW